ncbi:MAG: hypothetical protein HYX78_14745 [Armatimonadetes bacterium]|nr:hypothetical protein [Armatimonadota bacterium]
MNALRKLSFLLILLLLSVSTTVHAQGKVTGYTTWDDNYFYAGFVVDDPNVVGTNIQPHSYPWQDDCVEIFLEADGSHSQGRSKSSYHMAVSAAGGSAFTQGSSEGTWKRKPIITFKYAASVDGSVGNTEDLDVGYSLEMAIPWFELGLKKPPTPGTMMSFNVIVRMRGETERFVSLSPQITSEEEIHDASKWSNIVFTGPVFGAATLSLEKIVSARYVARLPLIDGQVRLNEYNKNTSFSFELPIDLSMRPKHQFQKTILTYYFYWYQGDPRKAAVFEHVREPDGRSMLTDHPVRGAGPWFSYDRVQWHKEELSDIRRAGIDIVLPIYWGDPKNRAGFAAKGLDCMVEALRELRAENKPYPLVGMFFDTSAMFEAYGSKPDLRDEEVMRTFYSMIRDFFWRVPDEFRAQVQMQDERSRPCYIIDLYTSAHFSDLDESFISYVNDRFAKDFDANIFWIGGKDFKQKSPVLDGYCSYGAGLGFGYDDSAKVRIAAVGPGYDDCAVSGRKTPIRARDGGDVYKTDWSKALDKRPNWIMIDGWNELHEGSDICGSRQYGFTYVDATALQSLKFRGARDYDAKYLRHNLPRVIAPGRFYQVDLLVQNDGIKGWRAGEGYALAYRWHQEGRLVAESSVKRPIQKDILPNTAAVITVGVAAVNKGGENMPEGDYEIRFEMVRMSDDKWFSSLGDEGFSVPVRIGKPNDVAVTFMSIDGPVMLRTATEYPYKVRVRNDGASVWEAEKAGVGWRLFRVANYVHGGPSDMEEQVQTAPARVDFADDVEPGRSAEVEITINLKDAVGNPIPAWKQSDLWSYELRFDVWDGAQWLSEAGARTGRRIIDVFETDYGVDIVAADVPDAMDAGKAYNEKLVVRNIGPDTWTPEKHSFGYHWYYLDGIEAEWDGERTKLKQQIKPGSPAIVPAKVTAPPYDGRYILAWDFAENDRWTSTSEISRGRDLLPVEVTVKNGKLFFADLSKLFDTVATSPNRNRQSGNFNGSGLSFPAEMMLPDTGTGTPNDIYPCGYLWKVEGSGLECSRRISFKYGPKAAGDKNAVTCAGQTVSAPKARYSKVHILGAAVEADQQADFGLKYQASTESGGLTMSSWAGEPAHGEDTAFVALHRHSAEGDERGVNSYLFHYTIAVDATRPLVEIILPNNEKMRVMAVTLERP